jgi:hypothetical protein
MAWKLPSEGEEHAMKTNERRLIVEHGFDCTVETVVDAFLREGFAIREVEAGDLRRHSTPSCALRYAVLEATIPELAVAARLRSECAPLLGCEVAVYEVVGQCTMVTTASPLADYPPLAFLGRRLTDRVTSALCAVTRSKAGTEATQVGS